MKLTIDKNNDKISNTQFVWDDQKMVYKLSFDYTFACNCGLTVHYAMTIHDVSLWHNPTDGHSFLIWNDIDVFETHDCFTSSEYAAISAFGISEPGKEYEAVENGVIAFDGAKPVNPSGGLIGCGHPVGASGARMFVDLYKQVTGQAGKYQVKDARNGMMLNIGGSATTNYVFIVGK